MDTKVAAEQICSIWDQLARTQYFCGYRPWTVAITGLLGVGGAALQSLLVPRPAENVDGYLLIWVSVAIVSVALTGTELAWSYARSSSSLERRLTRQAVQQFAPCLLIGAALSLAITTYHWRSVVALPGLWALCFSLGVFASRPYLRAEVGWVAAFYAIAGCLGLCMSPTHAVFSPLYMGCTFGGGQMFMAWMLATAQQEQGVPA